MALKDRINLKSRFRTGDRPTQEDFENVFDSFLNFENDQVSIDQHGNLTIEEGNLIVNKRLVLKTDTSTSSVAAGSIRWNGAQFEGYNGSEWGPLGGGDSAWDSQDDNLVLSNGNLGIGTSGTISDRLEVEQEEGEKSRFGSAILGPGDGALSDYAVFAHTSQRGQTQFALAQNNDGLVFINCAPGQSIQFAMGASTLGAWINGNFLIGRDDGGNINEDSDTGEKMQLRGDLRVEGSAAKDGGGEWDDTSDIRTKENVKPFTQGLDIIKAIDPIHFTYNGKANTPAGQDAVGVSAQELEKIFPDMVKHVKLHPGTADELDEVLRTNLSSVKFLMINAIKELDQRISDLEVQQVKEN